MSAAPEGVDLSDIRAAAYFAAPEVTPDREQAWSQWKDDYLTSVATNWTEQGTALEAMAEPLACISHELDQVDSMEWMPLGEALNWRITAILSDKQVMAENRLTFLNSLRTAETCSESERTLASAYHLGVSVAQITQIARGVESTFQREDSAEGRTALYRYFDSSGVLLYVGISDQPDERDYQHGGKSEWYRFQAHRTVAWFDSRDDAAFAERAAIVDERPLFNRTHNNVMRTAAIDYLFQALPERPSRRRKQVAS